MSGETKRGGSGIFLPAHYEPTQLDLAILRALPDQAARAGAFTPSARSVGELRAALDPALSPSALGARLRVLQDVGLVVSLRLPGYSRHGRSWQRTPAGREVVT